MPPKKSSKNAPPGHRKLERDRVGNLFADVPEKTGVSKLRISFRRNWYSPPFKEDGEIDYQRAADELSRELTGGTLVLGRYLENGDLGYATEIPVASKDDLEKILRTVRKVYVEGLKHENAIRQAGLDVCNIKIEELDTPTHLFLDRRRDAERRARERRGRRLLGRAWFRRADRRSENDRRSGNERRAA